MSNRISVTREGGVADVRMNRPEKMNALDLEMFQGLAATANELGADPSLRAVVLSGEGRAFCAGLDFASFMSMAGGGTSQTRSAPALLDRADCVAANYAQYAAFAWTALPVPVIAAVHGVAF